MKILFAISLLALLGCNQPRETYTEKGYNYSKPVTDTNSSVGVDPRARPDAALDGTVSKDPNGQK